MPVKLTFLNEVLIDRKGNFVAMILIILLIILAAIIAYAMSINPMTASMITECDPEKHLVLNMTLNKSKNKDDIFAMDHFYLGNFKVSLDFANKMISDKKPLISCTGLFSKSRCEFFLGDFEALKSTTEQYRQAVSGLKVSEKRMESFLKMQNSLDLLVAIAYSDKAKAAELINIEPWNNFKSTQGFVFYIRGLAAVIMDDKEEAIYRFKHSQELCEKTVLFELARKQLLDIQG